MKKREISDTPSPPFVSVIVPVLNGEGTIADCLTSLLKMDYPQERWEILVVDNGSTDRTAEIVQAYPVVLLREERRGAAAARNRGIEASRGEILAFTDADCVVSTGWLRELAQAFEDKSVAGVEGEIVAYPPRTAVERYAARIGSLSRNKRLSSAFPQYMITADVAFRREVFQRIGLFDTRFPGAGGEDVDFSWRFFWETDFKLRHASKAVVFHRHRLTSWELFTQRIGYGYARALLRAKYPGEVPWGWRQGVEGLLRAAWKLIQAIFLCTFTDRERRDVRDLSLNFVERLGDLIGFVRGLLLRGSS